MQSSPKMYPETNHRSLRFVSEESVFFWLLYFSLNVVFPQAEAWSDLVKFLQELCGLARHLQPNTRAELLGQLVSLGLFEVLPSCPPCLSPT